MLNSQDDADIDIDCAAHKIDTFLQRSAPATSELEHSILTIRYSPDVVHTPEKKKPVVRKLTGKSLKLTGGCCRAAQADTSGITVTL